MHCNQDIQDLEERLTFQKNGFLSQNERLTFLFDKQTEPSSTSSSTSTVWPKSLSSSNRHNNIEISGTDEARFVGPSDLNEEAASIQSDVPIPVDGNLRPVYYYEVKILDGGEHSYIGVGLSGKNCNLNGLPGWKRSSYGYHGDDGRIFEYSSIGRGRKYGEKFGSNDIIGCGFNLSDRSLFFTKNGKYIGIAFRNIDEKLVLFPTIGLNSIGERVEVNFGDKPFQYNVEIENILQAAHIKDLDLHDKPRRGKKRGIENDMNRVCIEEQSANFTTEELNFLRV